MKRILSVILLLAVIASVFTGCGKKDRILYSENLSKNIELKDYKGIKVDTKSDDFKEFYDSEISSDIENNDFYVKKTEGKIANGDTANIDYVGKKDGVAFEGGTASGYDLVIGSGSFITGFEDGLIDKEIGSTVDLNLTFPEDYQSTELAGEAVVFTVKINYAKTTQELEPKEYYSELDFKTLEAYTDDVTKRAVKAYLLEELTENAKVKEYPEKDIDIIYNNYKSTLEKQYNTEFETLLSNNQMTEKEFKDNMLEQIKPMMKSQMALYLVLDEAGLEVTEKDVDKQVEKMLKDYNDKSVTAKDLKELYGEYLFESMVVEDRALDYLYDNAKIS